MNKIGFDGGHSIYELGPAPDVVLFFDCVKIYAERDHSERNWSLLTDRLYRRYLRQEKLKPALMLMGQVQELFVQRPAKSSIEWDAKVLANSEKTGLNPEQPTLAEVFSNYSEHFASACGSAESFVDAFNIYQRAQVVISDLTDFAHDKVKPLAEYDALDGEPFWLRS